MSSSPLLTPGRLLLTLVALVTSTGCFIADWNETHIYNPTWTAHAKFHNGQTMSMGALLGVAALWYLYAPPSPRTASKEESKNSEMQNLKTVVLLDALYWVTQASAYAYPGSEAFDPIPGREEVVQDWLLQAKLEAVLLGMVGVGWWLESRRILAA
ncbi:hypothetical protein B0J12DRAFT_562343 [Macrophomina phaseolina]|nr:hypothetical protein B0J12DRAFT_562343 [Macrophomina phaseolina]